MRVVLRTVTTHLTTHLVMVALLLVLFNGKGPNHEGPKEGPKGPNVEAPAGHEPSSPCIPTQAQLPCNSNQ